MSSRGGTGDEGAVLVVVLIVLTVLSLGLSALLAFADTGERTTVAMSAQATTLAEANGAVELAVNTLRNGQYNNSPGQPCFGASDTLSDLIPSATGGVTYSAAVTCAGAPGTGGSGSLVPITSSNKPGYAIQTLSTSAAEQGIEVKSLGGGSNALRVHGQVLSNSTVTVVNGQLVVDNGVFATGACTLAGISSTPSASCNRGTTVADPGYASETPSLTYRPLSSIPCTTANSVVSFQPGYYDDAVGLSAMMDGNSPCKHSTWWFQPGVYYFDFHNGENAALPGGSHQWVVDDGTLIGGTPSGGATPPVNPPVPGACVSPITSTTAVGVQFIFGGDSRLQVDAGKAEICASYHSDRPPIAVYGQRTGTPAVTGPATVSGTSATSANFATPNGALSPNDGSSATWTGSGTAILAIAGMATPSSVPAGSQLVAATLNVRRMNTKGDDKDKVTVTLTPAAGGSAVTVTIPALPSTGWQDTTTDLTSTTLATLAKAVHDYGFTSASAQYSVKPQNNNGTESLDAVQLSLTYAVPSLRAENATINGSPSCVAKIGYGGGGTCAALSTTNAPGSVLYVQGTAYLPLAAVDITLNNVSSQVFKFGVLSRVLAVKINGSSTFQQAVIEIPDNSPGYGFADTDVLVTAYVCPGSSTCSPGSTPARLRARVRITDPSGTVVPGQRQITVTSWSLSH